MSQDETTTSDETQETGADEALPANENHEEADSSDNSAEESGG